VVFTYGRGEERVRRVRALVVPVVWTPGCLDTWWRVPALDACAGGQHVRMVL